MSEQDPRMRHQEASTPMYSYDAIGYEAVEPHENKNHAMQHETRDTPEVPLTFGERAPEHILAVTIRMEYFRLLTLMKAGNAEARQKLSQPVETPSQTTAPTRDQLDLAA